VPGGEEPAGGGGGRFGGAAGPWVLPGDYTIKLRAGAKEVEKIVKVDVDPRVPATPADLEAQLTAGLALRDLTTRSNATVERANSLITQLTALQDRLNRNGEGTPPGLKEIVSSALDSIKHLRDDDLTRPYPNMGYRQYPRTAQEIQSIAGAVSRVPVRPTDGQTLRLKELTEELDKSVAALNRLQSDRVGRINELMKSAPFILTEPIK
jgi:hypothetical protein